MRVRGGGAPLAWVWGVWVRALSHPRLPGLWAGCRGPLPTGCGCGGVRAWGPVTHPTGRAPASWLWALWGRHEGARGGRLLPGCGASGVGHSPDPDCPPSGRAAGAHHTVAVGAGGCGRGDPSPTPQRAFACCGGGMRVPGGGASCLGVGSPGSGALPPPTARPLNGLPGPTTYWLWVRGGAGVGTRHQPHSARTCVLALHAVEAARGRPGVASCLGVGRPGSGALPPPECPPSWRAAGAHYPLAVGAGGCEREDPSPTPQRALLRACFARCGCGTRAPGGGASCPGVGHPGSGAPPPPTALPLGGLPGPTTHGCGCGGVRAWGPVTKPTARALACCGGGMRVPGGGASCLDVGSPGSGALPPPTARPLGGLPGPTTHWLWVRGGAGVGTRHEPHSARTCVLALRAVGAARGRPGGAPPVWVWGVRGRALSHSRLLALWAGCRGPLPTGCGCGRVQTWGPVTKPTARALAWCGGGMRVPGGGASCLGVGSPGSGALPPPTARPLGGLPGPTTHWLWVRGGAGVGTRHERHSARTCVLALRAVGAAQGRPGGAPPVWVWGVRGRALSHTRLPALWAGRRGPLPTGCGCGWVRAWGPVTNPTARALASWLCARWGRHEGAQGGRLLPGCGASGVGRSPTHNCPPSRRAAGAHYPLAVGAGGCGRGDPSPTPQHALLRAVGAA